MEHKQKQMCRQYFFTDNEFMEDKSGEFNRPYAVSAPCAGVFDRLCCPVCLKSQLRYVAGLQTEHVFVWLKLQVAHLPPRVLMMMRGHVGLLETWPLEGRTKSWFRSQNETRLKGRSQELYSVLHAHPETCEGIEQLLTHAVYPESSSMCSLSSTHTVTASV